MSQACDGVPVTFDNLIQNIIAGGCPLDVPDSASPSAESAPVRS